MRMWQAGVQKEKSERRKEREICENRYYGRESGVTAYL
jgi:hypothetical protein